jgi:hypothetical protein
MSVRTPSPVFSVPLPPLTGELAGATEQNLGCRGADLFDRRLQAGGVRLFNRRLHLVKRGITGVYHGVGPQHLQSYLDEYAFRYTNRDVANGRGMFGVFLSQLETVSG